ncbi:hypothetical protein PUN28_001622 [Cardiocondyla obscurior]|uniref:Uncharacterized protein n=1 Tax=Cardiocondyla obscurior TaxID=286306 RepID=A0AAW2GQE3_9HYME
MSYSLDERKRDRCPRRLSLVQSHEPDSFYRRPTSDGRATIPKAPETRSRSAAGFLRGFFNACDYLMRDSETFTAI